MAKPQKRPKRKKDAPAFASRGEKPVSASVKKKRAQRLAEQRASRRVILERTRLGRERIANAAKGADMRAYAGLPVIQHVGPAPKVWTKREISKAPVGESAPADAAFMERMAAEPQRPPISPPVAMAMEEAQKYGALEPRRRKSRARVPIAPPSSSFEGRRAYRCNACGKPGHNRRSNKCNPDDLELPRLVA